MTNEDGRKTAPNNDLVSVQGAGQGAGQGQGEAEDANQVSVTVGGGGKGRVKTKTKTFLLAPSLLVALSEVPTTRSSAVQNAIRDAFNEKEKLTRALRHRMLSPKMWGEDNSERINVSLDPRILNYAQEMSKMTQLPIEQVVRLALEAYVFKL